MAQKKVVEYEAFVNEVLKKDLKLILDSRDEVYQQTAEYLQLKTMIEKLKKKEIPDKNMKTKVDLGCNFYVQAVVSDMSTIFVSVGYGFFAELSLEEALKFIDKKTAHLNEKAGSLTKKAASIKAQINLVLVGLREIQSINELSPESRQDLFI